MTPFSLALSPRPVFIYGLIDPRNGEMRYIGKTIDLKRRHLFYKNTTNLHFKHWLTSLESHGVKFEREILEVCNDDNWQSAESFWIEYHKFIGFRLINMTSGGEGAHGLKMSDEHKAKISASNTGKKRSPEQLERSSKALKGIGLGKKVKPEHIAKRVASRMKGMSKAYEGYQLHLFNIGNSNRRSSLKTRILMSRSRSLKKNEVEEVYRLSNCGITTNKMISMMFKIDPSTVSRIKNKKTCNLLLGV